MTFETKKRKLNTCMIDSLIDIEYTIAIKIREGERDRERDRERNKMRTHMCYRKLK